MRGTYVLLIELDSPAELPVGKRRRYGFQPGFYAYAGSGMGNLERRIARHLRAEKKLHWHIDYLLQSTAVQRVFYAETEERLECRVAGELGQKLEAVPGFGASDCSCGTHLFYSADYDTLKNIITESFTGLGLSLMEKTP